MCRIASLPVSLSDWLEELASSAPAPGGGAAAAVSAGIAAAALEMVANLSIGREDLAEHESWLRQQQAELQELRSEALELAAADARAFTELMAAYRLPKGPERREILQERLWTAADVPLQIAALAASVCRRSAPMVGRCNTNVITDVAVAASTAAGAIESAAVNVWINLKSIRSGEAKTDLANRLEDSLEAIDVGRRVAAEIRESIRG